MMPKIYSYTPTYLEHMQERIISSNCKPTHITITKKPLKIYNIQLSRSQKKQEINMYTQQQYLIHQQCQENIQKYQQIHSLWSHLYQKQKQQQIFPASTPHLMKQFDINQCIEQTKQNSGMREEISGAKLIEVLKIKFSAVFTDYLENMKEMIVNVQFEGKGLKRLRRPYGGFWDLILDCIEANQLLSQEKSKRFTAFLQIHKKTRQLIVELIENVQPTLVDQILYCLSSICLQIQQLLILDQQLKNNQRKLQEKINKFSHEIAQELFNSQKIKEIKFQEYQDQVKQEEKKQKYFQELITRWVILIIDAENNNQAKYKQEIDEALLQTSNARLWNNDFGFDSEVDEDEVFWRRNQGRKVRSTQF